MLAADSACNLPGFLFREGIPRNRAMTLALLCILVLEVVLFSWTFPAFFGSDSIFFFARRLENPTQILHALTSLDDRGNYRPFTHVFFSFVLYPLFKLDHVGYHFVPLLFHLLNTVLVFHVFRQLLMDRLAVVVATVYFGWSMINFFITYGITFMPDFTYALFYLGALACYLRFDETRKTCWLLISLAGFVLSLLCKEAAVTLPAVLVICLALRRAKRKSAGESPKSLLSPLVPYALLLLAYLAFFASMKGGIYSGNPGDPYRASFSPATLAAKWRYGWWAMNLPLGTGELKDHPNVMSLLGRIVPERLLPYAGSVSDLFIVRTRLLRLLLMLPLAALFFSALISWRREPIVPAGALWFLVALSPVLFLSAKTMRHNLYVPLIGFAAIMGVAVRRFYLWVAAWRSRSAMAGLIFLLLSYFSASVLAVKHLLVDSWPAAASLAAANSLEDMRKAHPTLPRESTLIFLDNQTDDLMFYFEGGNLFRIFYRDPTLRCVFAQRGDALPANFLADPLTFLFYYQQGHLYDVTGQYRSEALDRPSHRLLEHLDDASISIDENEPYPLKNYFGTPGNRPVFLHGLAAGGEFRKAVVTLAGAAVRFGLPEVAPGSTLRFGIAMAYETGDGAEGRIWLEHEGRRQLIFKRFLDPAHNPQDRRWLDFEVDLNAYARQRVTLSFECGSGPSRNTVADWLGWSVMRIRYKP